MLRLRLYATSILKYIAVLLILSVIISRFFPMIGLTIFALGLIGSFGAVKEDVEERYQEELKKQEQRRIMKVAKDSKDEFEGFEQAISLTRRNMQ